LSASADTPLRPRLCLRQFMNILAFYYGDTHTRVEWVLVWPEYGCINNSMWTLIANSQFGKLLRKSSTSEIVPSFNKQKFPIVCSPKKKRNPSSRSSQKSNTKMNCSADQVQMSSARFGPSFLSGSRLSWSLLSDGSPPISRFSGAGNKRFHNWPAKSFPFVFVFGLEKCQKLFPHKTN